MKKFIISLVIVLASVASVNAQSPVAPASDPQFMEIYNQAIELNRETYPDFRRIPINSPVAFPDYDENGIIYFPARVPKNGKNDCIWYLSLEYQKLKAEYDANANQQELVEPDSTTIEPVVEPIEESSNPDFWAWFIIIGLMLLVIAVYLLNRFRPWNSRGNINRRPVINGGLSNNAAEAASQISALTPGSRVVSSVRGRLICASPVKVEMNFSDGVKKVKLVSGEEYYKITQEDGTIRYARRACGNLVTGSISNLPEGVTFVPSTEENANWTATPAAPVTPVVENEIATEPAKKESYDFDGLAKVLGAAGSMENLPSKITFGELVIEFQPAINSGIMVFDLKDPKSEEVKSE